MGEPKGRGMSGLHAGEMKGEAQNTHHATSLAIRLDTGDEFTKRSSSCIRLFQQLHD